MNIPNTITIWRYIFSGLSASAVMLCSLAFFREILGLWYLYSSTLAFILGFIVSFLLQKFWTFKDFNGSNTHKQLIAFLIVSLVNLGINTLGMFVLVDKIGLWYFVSQVIVTTVIAGWSFFAYRAIF